MDYQSVVLPTLQIEDLGTVNGSTRAGDAVDLEVVDVDRDRIQEVREIKKETKKVFSNLNHLVGTDQGADVEAEDTVIIADHTVVAHKEAITSRAMVRECADVVVHQGAFSIEITAAEGAGVHAHKMARARQSIAVKRVPVDPHVQDTADVEPCVHAETIRSRNLKIIRLRIPLHLLNLKRVSLCRIQQQLKVLHRCFLC